MKICAIICEYNPFHNGHLYQIRQAKAQSGADAVLCLMSGNFVQRGDAAVLDKFTRAKHAVKAGADCVIELPAVFATSNAELFAKGAAQLLSSIPAVDTLCFGVEQANESALLDAAKQLNDEPVEISKKIKELTAQGMSFAKARAQAWSSRIDEKILTSPNCILAVEYARALLAKGSPIRLLPILRAGNDYKDVTLGDGFASATAVREALSRGDSYEAHVPNFVADDLPQALESRLDVLEKYCILNTEAKELARVCDCTEGLENAFKKAAELPATLMETLTSARYVSARIRRIALQNLLKIEEELIRKALSSPLYLRLLAIKKENTALLSALSQSDFPLLARAHDEQALTETAKAAYERDIFAERVYSLLYPSEKNKKTIFL